MRAVILAAGKGSRLSEVEPNTPKPMVKVDGVPVLARTVMWLVHHGIDEIVITTGHMANVIMDCFEDGRAWGAKISYTVEQELLGTAGGVKAAARAVPSLYDGPVLVWHGDNLSTCNPQRMLAYHHACKADGTVAVCWRENSDRSSVLSWGADNRLVSFEEKLSRRVNSGWISAGIYILDPELIDTLPDVGDFGRDVFPRWLVESRWLYVYGFAYDETLRWYDTAEDLAKVRRDYGH